MEVIIKDRKPLDPRQRILAIEAAMKAICMEAGEDPADGVMALLTAAVHMTMLHTKKKPDQVMPLLASCLGSAIVAADDFFNLREIGNG